MRFLRLFLIVLLAAGLGIGGAVPASAHVGGPSVDGLSPNTGSSAGRTRVQIFGSGFFNVQSVSFGALQAAFFFAGPQGHQIFTQSPAQPAGTTVDVTVVTGGGTSATTNADHFTYIAATAPVVNGVTPHLGSTAGGTFIQLFGSGFSSSNGQTSVTFGTNGTAMPCISGPGPGQLAVNGTNSSLTYGGRQTEATRLKTLAGLTRQEAPSQLALSPRGSVIGSMSQRGKLMPSQPLAAGGGPGAGCGLGNDSTLFVTSPPGALGAVPVWVTTQAGSSTNVAAPGNQFTYVAPGPPTVNALDPHTSSSAGGLNIGIFGSGFTGATGVLFNNTPAQFFSVAGDNNLNVQVPPQASNPSVVDVKVQVGASTSAIGPGDKFTYTPEQKPLIDAISPTHGSQGGNMQITIYGSNLAGTTAVNFGTTPAQSFFPQGDNVLQVFNTPAHLPGTVDITLTDGAGSTTKLNAYSYDPWSAPTVTRVSGAGGPAEGGNTVFITGSGFNAISNPPPNGVFFGTNPANAFLMSDNVIQAIAPAGTHGTTVGVTVRTPGGEQTLPASYTYGATVPPAPVVSAIGPSTGSINGGTTVFLSGSHLLGVSSVTFGGIVAPQFFAQGSNVIQAMTPAHAAGSVPVVVTTTEGGASNNTVQFAYSASPPPPGLAVAAVSPNQGTSAGGTTMQIFGSGFTPGAQVRFGNAQVMGFGVSPDGSTIFTKSPSQGTNAATVDVTVTVGATTSGINPGDKFTWTPPGMPEVDAVDPIQGSAAGGVNLNIFGVNLSNPTNLTFGMTPAPLCPFCFGSDNMVPATSPAGAVGQQVDVHVTTQAFPNSPSPNSNGDKFTFIQPVAPSIIAVEPNTGPVGGGTQLTIFGSGFSQTNIVKFGNNQTMNFFTQDDGHIFAQSPPGPVGSVGVTVTTPTATSNAAGFTYLQPTMPAVSAVSPNSGPSTGGTNIFISGTGLSGANAVNVGNAALMQFGFFVMDDGLIQTSTPSQGSNAAVVDVTVSTPVGTSPANPPNDQFTFTPAGPPAVTAISPTGGPPGTVVYVSGSNFVPGGFGPNSGSAVNFCSCGPSPNTVAAQNVQPLTNDLIKVLSPTSPISGNVPGLVDILVKNPDGSTSGQANADKYNYAVAPLPTITAIGATAGPPGTQVMITGTGLGAVTAVTFGAQVQNFFFTQSDTLIQTSAPGGPSGSVHITVTSAAGTSVTTTADLYTYVSFEADSPASSISQYLLAASDGTTWTDIDAVKLSLTLTPQVDSYALLSGNADLWTTMAGFNQDIGIYVAEADVNQYPGHIVAWKESGGFAGTFSPNAAFVQTLFPMDAGTTYHVKLQWKTNKSTVGSPGEIVVAGAGPWPSTSSNYSPTALAARLVPSSLGWVQSAVSRQQYVMQNSDGTTWQEIDPANLETTFTPFNSGYAVITANADLWTTQAGFNQDIGIYIPEANTGQYPGGIVGWKESGGFAGTFSPNAAFVQTVFAVNAGNTYHISLRWKTNKNAAGTGDYIVAGAGPGAPFSPTRLTVHFVPQWMNLPTTASNLQYLLHNSDGTTWQDIDATNLALTVMPQGPGGTCQAVISGNADLWTSKAGFNQDIGIYIQEANDTQYPGNIVAWKESGGNAGTFSPNAAFAQTVFPMTEGTTYHVKLRWKTNKDASNSDDYIVAGAGPSAPFSPSRLTVELTSCQ